MDLVCREQGFLNKLNEINEWHCSAGQCLSKSNVLHTDCN